MNPYVFRAALKTTFPVFLGYMAIGIGFGVLSANTGYPCWLALLCSLLMYAGSGQYFAVALFSAGASLSEIFLVEFLLSIRHVFYGISLVSKYRGAGRRKPYMMFALTDETFALLHGITPPPRCNAHTFYFAVSVLDHAYWCLGTLAGAAGYAFLESRGMAGCLAGVDFALTSLFIVILIEQLKKSRDLLPAVLGAASGGIAVALFKAGAFDSSNIIWTAICAALGVMFLLRGPKFFLNRDSENPDSPKPANSEEE